MCNNYNLSTSKLHVVSLIHYKIYYGLLLPLRGRMRVNELFVQVFRVPDGHPYNICTYAR